MEKHCRKNIIKWSTVSLAVLFAVLFIRTDGHRPEESVPPAISEMGRLYECELEAIRGRNEAIRPVFAVGDDSSAGSGRAELDVLCVTDSVISFVIRTSGEGAPLYGRDKYYNINRETGEHLDLVQILGKEYREIILDSILPKVDGDPDLYDGIDISPMINLSRPFYLAEGGRAVMIVFDLGEIAPDSAGAKIFRVEKK